MRTVREFIDIDRPISSTYYRILHFEDLPRFMANVDAVTRIDDRHQHWTIATANAEREFDVEIIEQVPEQLIAWRTISGDTEHHGVVTLRPLDTDHTRIEASLTLGEEDSAYSAPEPVEERIRADLRRLKDDFEDAPPRDF